MLYGKDSGSFCTLVCIIGMIVFAYIIWSICGAAIVARLNSLLSLGGI